MASLRILLGADHGGFRLKEAVRKWLESKGYLVEDNGCFSAERCDYPDYAVKVAREVASTKNALGILFCGTGIGMSIAANKIKGIRAALIHNEYSARMAKEHNNANIICLGGRVLNETQAIDSINAFLNAEFQQGRHSRRLKKITDLEK